MFVYSNGMIVKLNWYYTCYNL